MVLSQVPFLVLSIKSHIHTQSNPFAIVFKYVHEMGFPGSSAGKEFTCNAGDPDLIPEFGRSAGEGIGYPPQYSWTSLVAQLVKNPPAMQETWVRSPGWERLPTPVLWPGDFHGLYSPWGRKSQIQLSNFHF